MEKRHLLGLVVIAVTAIALTTTPVSAQQDRSSNSTGSIEDKPPGVASFLKTTPLSGNQTDPSSLAGKMRVESEYVDNTTVSLKRNTSTNYTVSINITGGAENVSFYLQRQAVEASQNISNVSMYIDGKKASFGVSNESGGQWISFVVDHFSTRTVTFTTSNTTQSSMISNIKIDSASPGGTATVTVGAEGVSEIDITGVPSGWTVKSHEDSMGTFSNDLQSDSALRWIWIGTVSTEVSATFSVPNTTQTGNYTLQVVPYEGETQGEIRNATVTVSESVVDRYDDNGDGIEIGELREGIDDYLGSGLDITQLRELIDSYLQ